jgi:hypothetical protein
VINALGYAPANASDLARVTTSPLQASNITTTGTLTVAQGADLGIRWPNDAYGGGSDTARITLESAGGEATRMRFTITNDPDDMIEFNTPATNGVKINTWTVHHDGNTRFVSGRTQVNSYSSQVGYLRSDYNFFDVFPPAGYTMSNLAAFTASIGIVYYQGGVNGDDTIWCEWQALGDRVRVWVANSEQRYYPVANWLGIWRI